MKKQIKFISCAVIVILAVFAAIEIFTNPLRQSESDIQLWLQDKTPIGMQFPDVQRIIDDSGWYNQDNQGSDEYAPNIFLRGELGGYWGIHLYTSVTVFWEFMEDQKLKDIRVVKTVDSL